LAARTSDAKAVQMLILKIIEPGCDRMVLFPLGFTCLDWFDLLFKMNTSHQNRVHLTNSEYKIFTKTYKWRPNGPQFLKQILAEGCME
jgi:hypothetical protein